MTIREKFPFFKNNPELVYLDSASTTQKPLNVINAITNYYSKQNSNAHRSNHILANQVTNDYEAVRKQVADFINAKGAKDIVWTKGTTDAINTVASAWGSANINAGDTIVVLNSEHHANFVPWQQLANHKGAHFKVVNILADGMPDLDDYKTLLALKPKLVALQHCSNALGNIHPISVLVDLAKEAGATTIVDGAQSVAHLPIDVTAINCDMYVFSAHKMYAPLGLGVLYINDRIKNLFSPYQFGGEMIEHVSISETKFRPIPAMLETGTQNISAIIALGHALTFLKSTQYQLELKEKHKLYEYTLAQLDEISSVKVLGNRKNNIGVISFIVDDEEISDISTLLVEQNIAIRSGHHCAMPLMDALNVNGTHRISLGIYNNKEDIDTFILALNKAIALLN